MLGLTWIIIWRKVLLQLHSHLTTVFFPLSFCLSEKCLSYWASSAHPGFLCFETVLWLHWTSNTQCVQHRWLQEESRGDLQQKWFTSVVCLWIYLAFHCLTMICMCALGLYIKHVVLYWISPLFNQESLKIEKSSFKVRPGQERNLYMPSYTGQPCEEKKVV